MDNENHYKGLGTPLNRSFLHSRPVFKVHQIAGLSLYAIDGTLDVRFHLLVVFPDSTAQRTPPPRYAVAAI